MAEQLPSRPEDTHPGDLRQVRRLMWFFGLVYVVEGLGQHGGLIAQPLNYYLKEVHGWSAIQISAALAVFSLPWVIKPLYGLVSDFVPLFGYRRKSYLVLANLGAVAAFLAVTQVNEPSPLIISVLITAYAMAISSTLCGAVLVENGQRLGASGRFVNQQWLWFSIAGTAAALLGGGLIEWFTPTAALHAAALIVAVAPFGVIVGAIMLIDERKSAINMRELKATLASLAAVFRRRELWFVGGFIFLYFFSPGFTTPLYYHMTDDLHFSQGYIGILNAIQSSGYVAAGLLYSRYFENLSLRTLLNVSIAIGTITTAAFVFLIDPVTAAILNFGNGFSLMIATIAALTLAADFCPKRSEGFAFAALMSISNLSSTSADFVGSYLYEQIFSSHLAPLVVVAASATAIAFFLVPILHLGDKAQGAPIEAVTVIEVTEQALR